MNKVFLKPGKERSLLLNRHPWIFSGAIQSFSQAFLSGDLAEVYSFDGQFLGTGYFHLENSLSGRMISWTKEPIRDLLKKKILAARDRRLCWIDTSHTNAYRLINAEADGLPGCVVDSYDGVLVLQIHTLGMEKLKPLLLELLVECLNPKSIYEKSTSSARLQEGLLPEEGLIWGELFPEVCIRENGISFVVSIVSGQKTGFFLDQREMRKKIGSISYKKNVLNCFAYSGGFSLYALQGGADAVTSVDICAKASLLNEQNTIQNGFSLDNHRIVKEDVFDFLRNEPLHPYQVIILDPPAFAKKRSDITSATKGYREINQLVLERCSPNTLLLSSSCSYYMDEGKFRHILFQAASEAKREVTILSKHIQAFDHPISLYHPEGDYLKSFFLYVE